MEQTRKRLELSCFMALPFSFRSCLYLIVIVLQVILEDEALTMFIPSFLFVAMVYLLMFIICSTIACHLPHNYSLHRQYTGIPIVL